MSTKRCGVCGPIESTEGCPHISAEHEVRLPLIPEIPKLIEKHVDDDDRPAYVPGRRDYSVAPAVGEAKASHPSVVYGARGEKGDRGERGLPGPAGKDADVQEVIDAAAVTMESVLFDFKQDVGALIKKALQDAGAINANGKAILLPGPACRDGTNGKDSTVAGPTGPAG